MHYFAVLCTELCSRLDLDEGDELPTGAFPILTFPFLFMFFCLRIFLVFVFAVLFFFLFLRLT